MSEYLFHASIDDNGKHLTDSLCLTKTNKLNMTKYIGLEKISAKRMLLFLVIAFVVSNIFRFNIFHIYEILQKDYSWGYQILREILEGSGVFTAGLLGLYLLRKQRKVDMSFFGTSKLNSLLMASIPTLLLIVIGVQNSYGINAHLYGLIAAMATFIYCIMEEYGWRGYLQEELYFLQPVIKYLLIGCIWYAWHLIFLMETTVTDNLLFLGTLILGSWGIGKIATLTNSILACSCFHLIVNIFMYNSFFNKAFSGTSKLIILGGSILLWIVILVKWNRDIKNVAL